MSSLLEPGGVEGSQLGTSGGAQLQQSAPQIQVATGIRVTVCERLDSAQISKSVVNTRATKFIVFEKLISSSTVEHV